MSRETQIVCFKVFDWNWHLAYWLNTIWVKWDGDVDLCKIWYLESRNQLQDSSSAGLDAQFLFTLSSSSRKRLMFVIWNWKNERVHALDMKLSLGQFFVVFQSFSCNTLSYTKSALVSAEFGKCAFSLILAAIWIFWLHLDDKTQSSTVFMKP